MPPVVLAAAVLVSAWTGAGCERREVGRRVEHGPVVARVDGHPLYLEEFEGLLPEGMERTLTLEEKHAYLQRWIETEVLYGEAVRWGLDRSPEIEARMQQFKKDLVSDQLVRAVIAERAVVTDEEARAFYEAHRDEYVREVRVSHILVNSLEDAEKVREMLARRSFSWVERRYSIDRHTGPGGDLGYLSKGNMIPEFENVVFGMKVGEISDVIESELGYHFIKVTATRPARHPLSYEEVADEITQQLLLKKRAAVYDSLISALVARAHVEILDPELRLAAEGIGAGPDTLGFGTDGAEAGAGVEAPGAARAEGDDR